MMKVQVLWPEPIRKKLLSINSEHFSQEETYDYIVQIILETEDLLLNPILGKSYTEEYGKFKGISRIVIRGFRIYYEKSANEILIIAVKLPGEK